MIFYVVFTLYWFAAAHCFPALFCESRRCSMFISEAVCEMRSALCCQQPRHQSRACRCAKTRSRPWMRAHLPEPGKAHGQVVNKWKWKIATTCGSCSSTCKRERRSGHDGCPVSPPLLIWSTKYLGHPLIPSPSSPFATIIDKQMCAGRPQAQKIVRVQNCLWDEKFCLSVVRVQSCFWVQVDCECFLSK